MEIKEKPSFRFIWEIENSLDSDLCDVIIDTFQRDDNVHQGIIGTGEVDLEIKDSTDTFVEGELWEGMHETCMEHINQALTDIPFLDGLEVMTTGFQVQLTKPTASVGYDWHVDTLTTVGPDGRVWERILTYIWYLNDDFEGGTTEFNTCIVEPKKGKLLFFVPSTTMIHKGNLPIGGDKYILTGWLWTPVPILRQEGLLNTPSE